MQRRKYIIYHQIIFPFHQIDILTKMNTNLDIRKASENVVTPLMKNKELVHNNNIRLVKNGSSYSMMLKTGGMNMTFNNIDGDEEMSFVPGTESFWFRNNMYNICNSTMEYQDGFTIVHTQYYTIRYKKGEKPQIVDKRTNLVMELVPIKIKNFATL